MVLGPTGSVLDDAAQRLRPEGVPERWNETVARRPAVEMVMVPEDAAVVVQAAEARGDLFR